MIGRRRFLQGIGSGAVLAAGGAAPAVAQSASEISFFYPVAVGGPITKLIDTFAADFQKENASLAVKPIYSGTYQDTIAKALTAHKSGAPPARPAMLPSRARPCASSGRGPPPSDDTLCSCDKPGSGASIWPENTSTAGF